MKNVSQKKIRLDELLVSRGYFPDAGQALRAVIAHEVKVGDAYASSAAVRVSPDVEVTVRGRKQFVSRGGYKLQGALDAFGQDVRGLRCLDAGASTGGFTDCLLQAGAASVTCVDVNYGQLAWKLRQDARVTVFERTNIKLANPASLGAPFDLIVADLSFIGLASLAPVFARLAHGSNNADGQRFAHGAEYATDWCPPHDASDVSGWHSAHPSSTIFIGLIKPQFESRAGETDRGIVRDESVRERTVLEVREALELAGFDVTGVVESPLRGAEGNVEYLVRAVFRGFLLEEPG